MKTSQCELSEQELLKELNSSAKRWRETASSYASLQKRFNPLRRSLSDINILLEILNEISSCMKGTDLQQLRENLYTWRSQNKSIHQKLDTFILESFVKECPNSTEEMRLDSHSWPEVLDGNLKEAKHCAKEIRGKLKTYQEIFQVMAQHRQAIEQQQALLNQNPNTKGLAENLSEYTNAHILKTLQKFYDEAESFIFSDTPDENLILTEAKVLENVAQDVFHNKPTLAVETHKLCTQIQEFCSQTEKMLLQRLERDISKATYKTPQECCPRLRELLDTGEKHIEGDYMDFTFTDTALDEFNSKSDIYKELAVDAINLGLSENLPNGSLSLVAGHPYVDKHRDDDLCKIRTHSGTSGDDNLPRIIVKKLPCGPNGKERFCVVALISKKEQEAATKAMKKALANRDVEAWPEDENDIAQLNPVSAPLSQKERQQIQIILCQLKDFKRSSGKLSKTSSKGKKGSVLPIPTPVPSASGTETKHPRAPKPKAPQSDVCHYMTLDKHPDEPPQSKLHRQTVQSPVTNTETQSETDRHLFRSQYSVDINRLVCLLQVASYLKLIQKRTAIIRYQKMKHETKAISSKQISASITSALPQKNIR